MSSEQVVTASLIWPIYLKLQQSILKNNGDTRYTCDLTQEHTEQCEHSEYHFSQLNQLSVYGQPGK